MAKLLPFEHGGRGRTEVLSCAAIRTGLQKGVFGAIGILVLVAIWEAVAVIWAPGTYIFPRVGEVVTSLRQNWQSLTDSTEVTLREVLIGFGLSTLLGVGLGIAMHMVPRFGRIFWPGLLVLQVTPQVAIAPLLVVWLGLGSSPRLILAVIIAFFPIVVTTHAGLRSVEPDVHELARSMNVGRARFLLHFEFPAAMPQVMTGLRIGLTYALIGIVVAEFFSSSGGLGTKILEATGTLDTPLAIASLVVLSGLGLVLYGLMGLIEALVLPWHTAARRFKGASS